MTNYRCQETDDFGWNKPANIRLEKVAHSAACYSYFLGRISFSENINHHQKGLDQDANHSS
jgi:hypothetical protein